MPKNISNRKYLLPELVELYHRADLVSLCLKENDGTCGVTVLLEMACRQAIICSHNTRLSDYLQARNAITVVDPGDVFGLQTAILHLLNSPQKAKLKGELADKLAKEGYEVVNQINILAKFIRTLEQ